MNNFIKTHLPKFAKNHPQIEITVSPRPRQHPMIVGHYINGKQREISVRNLKSEEIRAKAEELRDTNGEKMKRVNKPVTSLNESVRGIWSPFHGAKVQI
jgi:large subunit ribosomal protein L43